MDKRKELINHFYDGYREDGRLSASRHGQLEYLTTMYYIHKLLPNCSEIMEVGAGTGRYSVALAKEGYTVTALELADKNFEILEQNSAGISNLTIRKGDAVELGEFQNEIFDATLILGPMYHLYEAVERKKALSETVRVTKPGGIIMAAFLSVHAIMYDNYLKGNVRAGIEENFTENYQVKHFAEQMFTGYNVDEFEMQFNDFPVIHIATVAADGVLELAEGRTDFRMTDKDFSDFAEYHLKNCERRELLGSSSHLLYIGRKADIRREQKR